jgi:hypothetical protein
MNNTSTYINKSALLLASLALNLFLVAFLMGRCTTPVMMPSPFMGGNFHGAGIHGNNMPPPPPFFGPEALFNPKEMQENFSIMQNSFENGRKLREEFAAQLKKGKVTKEEVMKHFAEIDRIMAGVKEKMQEKAADKISAMSQEERKKFSDHLLEKSF